MRSVKTATGAARNVADVPTQKERNSHDRFSLSAGNDPPEAETERRRSVIHNTSNTSKQRLWIARTSLATLRQLVREKSLKPFYKKWR